MTVSLIHEEKHVKWERRDYESQQKNGPKTKEIFFTVIIDSEQNCIKGDN